MFLRLFCSAAMIVFLTVRTGAYADSCQPPEIPVGFVNLNSGPSPDFSTVDFVATVGHDAAVLNAMVFDEGPRRILVVFDRDEKLSADTLKGEQFILETISSSLRQDDQVAVMIARGRRHLVPFTKNRGELLHVFASEDTSAPNAKSILDTVLEANEMFGPPQSGDAIVVVAAGLGGNDHDRSKVLMALLQHRIRLFGIALGPVARHYAASENRFTTSSGSSTVTTSNFDIGDENFHSFTTASGGFVLVAMNPYPFRPDNINDPNVESRIETQTKAIVKLVTRFFRIQVEAPRAGSWRLELTKAARKSAPGVLLLYPHELWPCAH